MIGVEEEPVRPVRLPLPVATGAVLILWLPYVALNALFPGPLLTYLGGALIALAALGLAAGAGLGPAACSLRLAGPSWEGALVLTLLMAFLPLALLVGEGERWDWQEGLVAAPASAVGQELYFRGALLAGLARLWGSRPTRVLALQAALFALWHVRAFRVVSAPEAALVLAGALVAGCVWGWQVRRDGTLAYAAAQHTLYLMLL